MILASDPILSCEEARQLESNLFAGEEGKEWGAMQQAGQAVGSAVLRDSQEMGGLPATCRILVVVGKGHNGGDALIAVASLLEARPGAEAEILFAFGERMLRPLTARAWRHLLHCFGARLTLIDRTQLAPAYDVCLDGVFGFQFRPPVDANVQSLIERVNALAIRFRAAVDMPSAGVFQADFTYATGSVKAPVLETEASGRIRYLDLGFFARGAPGLQRVLTPEVLSSLTALRSAHTDKRSFGHLFVLGGSRSYPGAILMAVLAALRSGVGLLTAFVPESLVPAFAAGVPEVIWVGLPEAPDGGVAWEGLHLIRRRMDRATAWLIGPGMTDESETVTLAREVVQRAGVPIVLDADGLQGGVIEAAQSPLVLTPHAGEFRRIAGSVTLEDFALRTGAVVVLKGPMTRIAGRSGALGSETGETTLPVFHSLFGGPVLARGGSGDLLAGLIGGILARPGGDPLQAAAQGTVWHGLAADRLAQRFGQVAIRTTLLLELLPEVLREIAERRGANPAG